ncbi:MAG: TspO/MBR family protein [Candidatus Paceibacterota bacterium]|jgi:tryptophan-rich sensory protein
MKNFFKLVVAIAVPLLAGFLGSIFTTPQIETWYATLVRPDLAPPNWIFGPVWTTLFVLMGIALFLVWKKRSQILENVGMLWWWKLALVLFFVQLVLNILWSLIFFAAQNPAGAFVELIILWLAIAATIFVFAKVSRPAAWLLVPYILWVSFAGYLNFMFWQLNSPINSGEEIVCTMDAKQCPDGSFVGRIPPDCDFAPCP